MTDVHRTSSPISSGGAAYKSPSASLFRLQTADFRLHANDAPSAFDLRPLTPAK